MSFSLAKKNIRRRPGRSAALIVLAAFLSLSVFAGSVVVGSLRRGLRSYEARLGADIVAVPYEAQTKKSLEAILLQGIPGYFYMDQQYFDKIAATEGVEAASPQFFLASASAGCCSVAVQIIGFDPETDFSIQPWIRDSYAQTVGDGDILIGSKIEMPLSGYLTFYDTKCRVAAQLEETGTGLDNAVYANRNTIKQMISNAQALGFREFDGIDPDHTVSAAMVKVAEGYDIEEVCGDINIHVRHIEATQAKSMISGIAGGLRTVSRFVGLLTALIWALALAVLAAAFVMIAGERKRELAVLRVMGASQKMVSRLLLTEGALTGLLGGGAGVLLGALIVFPFSGAIGKALSLPYLRPGAGELLAMGAGALLLSTLAGALASGIAAGRVSRQDVGLMLREGA